LVLPSSRAKDGAISPRLANRYSRFALSHRSCGDGAHRVGNGNNVLKDHSHPPTVTVSTDGGGGYVRGTQSCKKRKNGAARHPPPPTLLLQPD
jgi:hypothetical protein